MKWKLLPYSKVLHYSSVRSKLFDSNWEYNILFKLRKSHQFSIAYKITLLIIMYTVLPHIPLSADVSLPFAGWESPPCFSSFCCVLCNGSCSPPTQSDDLPVTTCITCLQPSAFSSKSETGSIFKVCCTHIFSPSGLCDGLLGLIFGIAPGGNLAWCLSLEAITPEANKNDKKGQSMQYAQPKEKYCCTSCNQWPPKMLRFSGCLEENLMVTIRCENWPTGGLFWEEIPTHNILFLEDNLLHHAVT